MESMLFKTSNLQMHSVCPKSLYHLESGVLTLHALTFLRLSVAAQCNML